MLTDPTLWERLHALAFDDIDAAFPLSSRLARDNGWTRAFAERVLREYKRFAYLACVAGHPVTPSDEVDQAWHLHLVYTHHYWGDFADALGREFHHGPTKGGEAEDERFLEQYRATLDSYRREFDEEPPSDIWPSELIRFGEAPSYRRVNTARNWVIRKPGLAELATMAVVTMAGVSAALAVIGVNGAKADAASSPDDRSILGLLFIGGVAVFIAIGYISRYRDKTGRKRTEHGGGCGSGSNSGCDSGCGGSGCGGGGCGS